MEPKLELELLNILLKIVTETEPFCFGPGFCTRNVQREVWNVHIYANNVQSNEL